MYSDIISGLYQEHLGRAPDAEGLAYYLSQAEAGRPIGDIEMEINRSIEGQRFDTQYITSQYRGLFGRNPEQEGFQFWLSEAQKNAWSPEEMSGFLIGGAQAADIAAAQQALAQGRFTNIGGASLEADPYGGRYMTQSIYDVPTDAANLSYIDGTPVQFVAPVTQAPIRTSFAPGQFQATAGQFVLDNATTAASVSRALNSGAMNMDQYGQLLNDLGSAKTIDDVQAALNKPQANLVLDPIYSVQLGQGTTLAEAQNRANAMIPVLDAVDQGFYPSNMTISEVAQDMGVFNAFGPEAFQGYNTQMTAGDILRQETAAQQAAGTQQYMYQNIGTQDFMPTPIPFGYYSERGLERDFTYPTQAQPALQLQDVYQGLFNRAPDVEGFNYWNSIVGPTVDPTELGYIAGGAQEPYNQAAYERLLAQAQGAPMFRSGVFGYTPTAPTGFEFGTQPIIQQIPTFTPGAFNFNATGYDAMGNPIFAPVEEVNTTVTDTYDSGG